MHSDPPLVLGSGQYFGARGGERHVGGFQVTERSYAPLAFIPEHVHENPFFSFVLDGLSTEQVGSRKYERSPSMLIFHPSRERHENSWGRAGGSCLHVEISRDRAEQIQDQGLNLSRSSILQCPSVSRLGSKLLSEFRQRDSASSLAIEGLVLELLSEIARGEPAAAKGRPAWLDQARYLVGLSYCSGIGVGELASQLGVSASHLAVSYHRAFGCTIGEDVRSRRVADASRELLNTDLSIGEIALDCGFADQPHFSKVFRNVTGKSPAQFRREGGGSDKR